MPNYRLTVRDNRNNIRWYLGDAVEQVEWSTYLEGQPGKLTFTVHKTDGVAFWEGATVWFSVDGELIFQGIVFKKERTQDVDLIKVTAYDFLVYLKNKDAFVFEQKTLGEIFTEVCEKFERPFIITGEANHQCADRIFDNKSGWDVIQTSIDDTLINTGEYWMLRSVNNTIQLVNSDQFISNLVLGDNSGIISFNYTTSIDDSYNQVKGYRDNQDTGRREIYIVKDSDTIGIWGLLQYYLQINDTLNAAQIEERVESVLRLYNKTGREFKCNECLGHLSVFAGAIVRLQIADLGDITLNDNLLIDQCTHTFTESYHHMGFTASIIRDV